MSREVLSENLEVLLRPDLQLDAADVLGFGLFLARHAEMVAISGEPQDVVTRTTTSSLRQPASGPPTYL